MESFLKTIFFVMNIIIYILLAPIIALIIGVMTIARYTRRRVRYRGIDDRAGLELTKKNN